MVLPESVLIALLASVTSEDLVAKPLVVVVFELQVCPPRTCLPFVKQH
jgi:hypothetical protein